MQYRGRFAPSPTGPLHMGSLVAALGSWLDARAAGGEWFVRVEDLDPPREVAGAATTILEQLGALGLAHDGLVEFQSQRSALYDGYLKTLASNGHSYGCACTRRQVGGGPYPGTCRDRGLPSEQGISTRVRTDRIPAICYTDRLHGQRHLAAECIGGDFVVRRRDGLYGYLLASVVDDAEQGISDVVRGADLFDVTAQQVLLQQYLGFATPRYLHLPVVVDAGGNKLSKQNHAPSLDLAEPGQCLREALALLGQEAPAAELDRCRDILRFAVDHWRPERLPGLEMQLSQ